MKAKKFTFKKESIYIVKFLDHNIGTGKIDYCEIIGWYQGSDDNFHLFRHWGSYYKGELDHDNLEIIKIVKGTILSKKLLHS